MNPANSKFLLNWVSITRSLRFESVEFVYYLPVSPVSISKFLITTACLKIEFSRTSRDVFVNLPGIHITVKLCLEAVKYTLPVLLILVDQRKCFQ